VPRVLIPLLTAVLLLPALARAQAPLVPFEYLVTNWSFSLDEIERDSRSPSLTPQQVRELKGSVSTLRGEAQRYQARARALMRPLQAQLDALGPKPEADAPAETADIAKRRGELEAELTRLRGDVQKAQLVIARADGLDQAITARTQQQLLDLLANQLPIAFLPSVWTRALPELAGLIGQLLRAPFAWWEGRAPELRRGGEGWKILTVIGLAFLFGLVIRILARRRFGRHPGVSEPSYARRFSAAVAEAVASGIVPSLIFGGLLYRVTSGDSPIDGLFADMVAAFCRAMILIVLAWSLPRAALSPSAPDWRLLDIAPGNARRICLLITLLFTVGAIDIFFRGAYGDPLRAGALVWSRDLQSVYLLGVNLCSAVLIIALARPALWRGGGVTARPDLEEADEAPAGETAADAPGDESAWPWRSAGRLAGVLAAVAIGASLLGYAYLGLFITWALLDIGIVTGVLLLARGVLRELIGVALRSRFLQTTLGLPHATRSLLKFWIRLALDLVTGVLWVLLVLPVIGIPGSDVWRWTRQALTGVEVGNITVSVTDIVVAAIAFLLVVLGTRMIQHALEQKVLPHTRLDIGVRNSVKAGFGYLGVTVAAVLAISALGLDLSNLAIIAGALSVGIGFGLQTIVNNFVSGLILLIERPIKAGDWIVIGEHEGFVKRINVRATEIETFRRASVIIPNSELLSSAVVNWTHKDQYGRVEVPVGVAYGSDVEQVMRILLDCLRAHPKILKVPEPFVVFMSFGESSLDFEARGYIDSVIWRAIVGSDLRVAIYKALAAARIEIPFPQRDLHIKDLEALRAAIDRGEGRSEAASGEDPAQAGDGESRP